MKLIVFAGAAAVALATAAGVDAGSSATPTAKIAFSSNRSGDSDDKSMGSGNRRVLGVVGGALNKRVVDLDHVDREMAELTQ